MRRTAKTSVSPTMGIVVAAIGKIDFGPVCASACVVAAAPASASAPVVRMVLRSSWSMGILPLLFFVVAVTKKARAEARALSVTGRKRSVLDLRRQLAAIGRELGHHLLVQPDVHAGGIVGVAGVAELLGKFLARREA